jgi:DtxR family Mn-dependent transcriptional regulator
LTAGDPSSARPPPQNSGAAERPQAARTAAVEDYLKWIYNIEERRESPVTVGELAHRLGITPSSVSGMVRKLAAERLVVHRRYGGLELTAEGRRAALMVLRRQRLIETYLVAALGYGWDEVQEDAEVLEHVISDRLLDRIDDALGHPTRDPHGDPIPAADGTPTATPTRWLSDLQEGERGRLVRVVDAAPSLLRWLTEQGVAIGDPVEVLGWEPGGTLRVRVGSRVSPLALGESVASSIAVDVRD